MQILSISEVGSRKSEVGSRKSEVGSRKSEVNWQWVLFLISNRFQYVCHEVKRSAYLTAFYFLIISPTNLNAQSLMEIQLNPTIYNGGYHIRCFGDNNGSINAVLIGGEAPFSFVWSTGSTQQILNNLVAGTYTVTVTQNGNATASASISLHEPQLLDPTLYSATYEGGTNISINGGNDGSIELTDQGGTPPYTFLWSNSSEEQNLYSLTAGTYTVTVTDVNACSVTRSIVLTEPTALTLVSITSPQYNGFNLHCNAATNGQTDGAIDLTVTGGTPPYQFQWNNGSFDEDPTGLPEGDYSVRITDANSVEIFADITLSQPPAIDISLFAFEYPNGYNISLFNDYNGSITTTVSGGVAPLAFSWNDGTTTQNRTNIGHGNFTIQVTDANGCAKNTDVTLTQPPREGWALGGNANIDTATQFIGTTDSVDAVFKTHSLERIRLTGDGLIKFKGSLQVDNGGTDTLRMVYVDQNGILKIAPGTLGNPPIGAGGCWGITNHWFTDYCNHPFDIFTFPGTGKVGIGTSVPKNALDVNGRLVIGNGYAGTISATNGDDLLVAGNVGIGTTNPSANFQIGSDFVFIKGDNTSVSNAIGYNFFNNNGNATKINSSLAASCIEFNFDPNHSGDIIIKGMQGNSSIWNSLKTTFYSDGRVYIGTGVYNPQNINSNSADYCILSVQGTILSSEVRVLTSGNWPDYVFDKNYKLPELSQTEKFIKENHHLPDLPTALEVDKNGQELGKMNILLLKKIEEITLYLIELNKKNEKLTREVDDLKRKN